MHNPLLYFQREQVYASKSPWDGDITQSTNIGTYSRSLVRCGFECLGNPKCVAFTHGGHVAGMTDPCTLHDRLIEMDHYMPITGHGGSYYQQVGIGRNITCCIALCVEVSLLLPIARNRLINVLID